MCSPKNLAYILLPLFGLCFISCGVIPNDHQEAQDQSSDATTNETRTYTISGVINGLEGLIVLQNKSEDNLIVNTSNTFSFSTKLANGASYKITILSQPEDQVCTVNNSLGTVQNDNITNVTISCLSFYTIGGDITNLNGSITLQNDAGDDLIVTKDGRFSFAESFLDGQPYEVTLFSQPQGQTCTVTNGHGAVSGNNIVNIGVHCLSKLAGLSALNISKGQLSATFDTSIPTYSVNFTFLDETVSLDIAPTVAYDNNQISIGDTSLDSGSTHTIDITLGTQPIDIVVTAEDGSTTQTYRLNVVKETIHEFAQQAYLKASNSEANDYFGDALSLSGDTLAVGAYFEDSNADGINGNQGNNNASTAGAVYVFTRSGNTWTQQAYLKASNSQAHDQFGEALSLSGDTLAVGAWSEASNATGINGDQSNNSAHDSGAVYVFTRSGNTWTQQAYLKASNSEAYDRFGDALSLSGDTLAVGAFGEASHATGINGDQSNNSAADSGAVYVFTRSGDTWTQQAYLKASNSQTIDRFGDALSLSGDTLAVGAYAEDSGTDGINGNQGNNNASTAGAVYVFTRSGDTWTQQAYLKASNSQADDQFGDALSLSGDTLAVGAWSEASNATGINGDQSNNNASDAGAVYVFTRSGNTWTQQAYLKASNSEAYDRFGDALSLSGDTLAVGAYAEDSSTNDINGDQSDNSSGGSGAVYLFTRSGDAWTQQGYLKASNNQAHDRFGDALSLSGDTLAVGAYAEDSGTNDINGDQSKNNASDAGAAYIFR